MPAVRTLLAAPAALALAAGLLLVPSAPAQAVTGVFISEFHYDDSTTNDAGGVGEFVEVTAPAGTSLEGWTVQLVNGSNLAPYKTDALTGVVADQAGGWGTAVVNYFSASGGAFQNGAPDGIALINASGTVVEFFAYEGPMTANLGTPATSTVAVETGVGQETNTTPGTHSVQRQVDGSWAAPAVATKGAPNGQEDDGPTPLAVTDPADRSVRAGQAIAPINLQATGGTGPYTWSAEGLPADLELIDAQITGTPAAPGTHEVTVTVTDSATPAATASQTFVLTVTPALAVTPIHEVQGTGAGTPMPNQDVLVEGVVTASYPTGGFNGFYVQTPGTGGTTDTTPGASDAIFVWGGSTGFASYPAVGDSVQVSGRAVEGAGPASGLTQITNGVWSALDTPLAAVTPLEVTYPATDAEREALEGMLVLPTETFTVSNSYNVNSFAEIGLAVGDEPLRQPTEFAAPSDTAAINAIKAQNAARAVALDDGSSVNYMTNSSAKNQPLPWLTPTNPIRVGADVTFESGVIFEFRNNVWKFQPRTQLTNDGTSIVTFENTRLANGTPQDVGGDLKIATFNVLNYFNTTGYDYAAEVDPSYPQADTHCSYYKDRSGADIGNDSCGLKGPGIVVPPSEDNDGRGPRGAATDASLARQEEKLVHAINLLDADVIGLEEIENSIKLPNEGNRDDAVSDLVAKLNDAAGSTKWGYVVSPPEAVTAAAVAEQDVIRPAFIYQVDTVEPVGQSEILFGTTEFANAREPLAQVFKAKGAPDSDGFAMIVNHFKSKGDNPTWATPAAGDNANDTETGVGAFNGDRTRQAERLVEFADDFAASRGVGPVFLAGDFNSYSKEDPVAVIEDGDYTQIESDTEGEETYSYNGLYGSLDHIFANPQAEAMVEGADIWSINSVESVAFQYSRYNYNATDFWQPNQPFGTSDHDPEIVGINVPGNVETPPAKQVQIVATNDFHGRLLPDGGNAAGAAALAGRVDQLRAANPDTVFVAAGDLVGGSTFESFIQQDKPTIDALNAAGLEVSAAGNHEFDRGYDDFVGRIQDRAQWEYIAANVDVEDGMEDLSETWVKEFGDVKVGFVGAVTEDLPNLVAGDALNGVTVTDVVESVNAAAEDLKTAEQADVVVLLVHEGAPTTGCDTAGFTDPATVFGNIVQNTSPDVDAIISGHTHLAYNCRFPVEEWSDRAVKQRPVVSAGQYGANLNQLVLSFDDEGDLSKIDQNVLAAAGVGAPENTAVAAIVQQAVDFAAEAGAEVLGKIEGPFRRATYTSQNTSVENRGGESTLNNLVAEVQRWATADSNGADIAFMNPGGLRADMAGEANGVLTYRQAADVQPFANTLVNMKLTGAQIKKVLEQQWQRTATGHVPSRPFLRLGVSEGFTYTYTTSPERVTAPNAAPVDTFKGTVTGMWLNGEPIDPTATYSVTANSFLAGGGDNFWELANGSQKVDTGKGDLEAVVGYMEQHKTTPLEVDYAQRAVQVKFPASAPASYEPGATVAFDVSSWSMTGAGDAKDTQLQVKLGDTVLKSDVAVTTTSSTTPYDESGTAAISVTLPAGAAEGNRKLTLVGTTTGTEVTVPIVVDDGTTDVQILATNDFHGRLHNNTGGTDAGAAVLAGAVKQLRAANPNTVFAAAGDLIGASTFDSFILQDKPTIDALNEAGLEVSAVGNHELDKGYADLVDRVMAEGHERGGANWEYIAANLTEPEGADEIEASWTRSFGDIEVGFVGAVTEDLMTLIQAEGNEGVGVTDIVEAVNDEAAELKAGGADIVVMLVHEGAPSTSCDLQDGSVWEELVSGVGGDVDAIVSGHTHFGYNCQYPVPEWADDATRTVKNRPVVSAGQYGSALNQLVFTVDDETDRVVAKSQALLNLKNGQTANYPVDLPTKAIVDKAAADADGPGSVELGSIEDPFLRAKFADGATENRGGESTLNNLVAEVQRWATPESVGGAEIAFMNAGGLRDDMVGLGTGEFPRQLTYRQAANVQSFANTLVNMDLTGAQIKTLLEQQWQRAIAGDGTVSVPARSFIKLGVSDGFTYTYDQAVDPEFPAQKKGTVTGMWLGGEPIDLDATYSVTVNSFLSTGGDNFHVLKQGANKQDTGKVDLESMVDYMAAHSEGVEADYGQRAVGVHFADDDREFAPGEEVAFDLYSLSMSGSLNAQTLKDITDDEVAVRIGGEVLDTFKVTTTLTSSGSSSSGLNDDAGTSSVQVTLPAGLPAGATELTVEGLDTGTIVRVPIEIEGTTSVDAGEDLSVAWDRAATISVEVTTNGDPATGSVQLYKGETAIGEPTAVEGDVATVTVPARSFEPGAHTLRAVYSGGGEDELVLTVTKATTSVTAGNVSGVYGQSVSVQVQLGSAAATGTVAVRSGAQVLGTAAADGGAASVTIPGGALEPGSHTLTVEYAGDSHFESATGSVAVTVSKVTPTVTAGNVSVTYGRATTVTVNVSSGTGTVQIRNGSAVLGSATVANGSAQVTLQERSLVPGTYTLTAAYSGDGRVEARSTTFTATVAKAGSTTKVTASPSRTKVKGARVTLKIAVNGQFGVAETGKVKVTVPGQGTETVTLKSGKATLKLEKFTSPGKKTVKVEYLGSDLLEDSSDKVTITVAKANRR